MGAIDQNIDMLSKAICAERPFEAHIYFWVFFLESLR